MFAEQRMCEEGKKIAEVFAMASELDDARYLLCDGTLYSRDDYPELYDAIGSSLRDGDTGFYVPDLYGRYIMGINSEVLIGGEGGEYEITLTTAQMPVHTHSYGSHTHLTTGTAPGPQPVAMSGIPSTPNTASSGSGQPHSNVAPYTLLFYYIVAKLEI